MKRTKERIKQTAECFTPAWLVDDMLKKLPEEIWEGNKTFLDPACGSGNLLVQVLIWKLNANHDPLEAISTLYGCDIMQDNIDECRERLVEIAGCGEDIVKENIVWTPITEETPNGALDYL